MPSEPFAQTLCLVMSEGEETQVVVGIGGFEHEWGYRYELIIRESEPDPGLADSPPILRDLVEVVAREKVPAGTVFEMRLETILPTYETYGDASRQIITREAPDRFAFFKEMFPFEPDFGREFTCTPALCEELAVLIEQKLELVLRFAHPESPDESLVAKRIVSQKPLPEDQY